MVPTDYLSGLENWLTNENVETYLDLIQVNQRMPTLTTLRAIIRQTYACIPFQNLTMQTRPRQPPCLAQIRDVMLNGLGGLCTTINPFLCGLLLSLGFQAGLLKVSLAQPYCHIGVIVSNLQGRDYWLDEGNGFPYLEPLPLEDGAKHKVLSFSYPLLRLDDGWGLKQTVLGSSDSKINQQFTATPCYYAEFTSMRHRHYTQHDYYVFNKENFNRVRLDITNIDWEDIIRKLYIGKSTTPPVYVSGEIAGATGRERGGATLALNSDVLAFKNHSMQCGTFVSRRSDMLMATDAKDAGFRLFTTPAILAHERCESFDTHDVKKLIGDILGYALVEAKVDGVFSESEFRRCYSERMERTKAIISDTSKMLMALIIWLERTETVSTASIRLIHQIINENSITLTRLNEVNTSQILQ